MGRRTDGALSLLRLCGLQEKRQLKPAALEELNRIIRFPVIKNDNEPASMILLTGLKCLCVRGGPRPLSCLAATTC